MNRSLSVLALAALASGLATAPARAQFTIATGMSEIQEDWQLVIAQGDSAREGPQIMTYMSPVSDASKPYAWFLINVRDQPNAYTPGGLQVQVWDPSNSTLVTSLTSSYDTAQLNTPNETITWTQRMVCNPLEAQPISYTIQNGNSTTWGTFGAYSSNAPITFPGPTSLV